MLTMTWWTVPKTSTNKAAGGRNCLRQEVAKRRGIIWELWWGLQVELAFLSRTFLIFPSSRNAHCFWLVICSVLILVSLVLRIVAMARTKFWKQASFWEANRLPGQIALPTKMSNVTVSWRPAYKVQFSMTFLKQGEEEVEAPKAVVPTPVENTKVQDSADEDAETATLI